MAAQSGSGSNQVILQVLLMTGAASLASNIYIVGRGVDMNYRFEFKTCTKAAGLLVMTLGSVSAYSQAPTQTGSEGARQETLEEIVVTGSSLRGVEPVGAAVTVIGAAAVDDNAVQTVQQLLQTTPQIWGMNGPGQGAFATFDASGLATPQIHGIGGANSSSTLTLIDGHRFPLMGVRRNLPDPNFIPPNAIQRVEVLAEGASSVYGSDAVAGVINFITHDRYEGLGLRVQTGFGDDYDTWSGSVSLGHRWDDGGAAVFYSYSDRSELLRMDRPLTMPDQTAHGGGNFLNYNCSPTSFQPAGDPLTYLYPYDGAGISGQANAPCTSLGNTALLPHEQRHSVMVKLDHQVSDRLSLNGDVVYSDRHNAGRGSVGSIAATVFGPGSGMGDQINPFFVAPQGTGATSGTVRFDADELFPEGAVVENAHEIFYAHGKANYDLTDNWRLSGFFVAGNAISQERRSGELCNSCLLRALNGSSNSNGNLAQPANPDLGIIVNNVPLTEDNAVDLWNPLASNRTSAAVMQQLTDSRNFQRVRQTIQQYNVALDGGLFSMPAGEVKVAVGADFVKLTADSEVAEPNGTGPSSLSSSYNAFLYERTTESVFAEVLIPVISDDMGVPGVRKLDFNVSGRYDYYDEWGGLTNPRYAFTWEVFDGFRLRGNYAESFVAPQFSTYGPDKLTGQDGRAVDNFFSRNGRIDLPISNFPEAALIPGCDAPGQEICVLGISGRPGFRIDGANPDVGPATGKSWAIGFDYLPSFAEGLSTRVTFWHTTLEDAAGAPPINIVANSTRFRDLIQVYPNGATPEQIEAFRLGYRQREPLDAGPQYFSVDFRNFNVYTVFVEGIDFDINYYRDLGWGSVHTGLTGTHRTRFDQTTGPGEPVFSILNKNRFIGTFPAIQTEMRAEIGVDVGAFRGKVFANYTGSYTFWGGGALNPLTTDNGIPTGGGDPVDSYTSVNLNLQYDLGGRLPGENTVFLDVDNLFDENPPFVNGSLGFDTFGAFPMGRIITIGLRSEF
jgi:iron complex outermembrane receptor protein